MYLINRNRIAGWFENKYFALTVAYFVCLAIVLQVTEDNIVERVNSKQRQEQAKEVSSPQQQTEQPQSVQQHRHRKHHRN